MMSLLVPAMVRLFSTTLLVLGCVQCTNGTRTRERGFRKGSIWDESSINDYRRRRRTVEGRDWAVQTYSGGKGKGKGGHTGGGDGDSDDVGGFPFPTIAPMGDNVASGGASTPPPSTTPQSETNVTSDSPPPSPAMTPPTESQSNIPTLSPESAAQKAACEAAANSQVYKTQNAVTVRFLYELLYPYSRPIEWVASNVDERVQDFLVTELVDCENQLESVGGVGPGEVDRVVDEKCSQLIPVEKQKCHLMEGTVVLYFLSSGGAISQEESFDRVEEKLQVAFNGARRSLQSRFVDEDLGILALHYIGGNVDEEGDATKTVEGGNSATLVASSGGSSRVVPAAVIPVVLVAIAALIFTALFVVRRRRQSHDPSRGLLLGHEDDSSLEQEGRWKEVAVSKNPLSFRVVETTTDESGSSDSSGGAALAAYEVVMEDLSGMTLSESISDIELVKPVFVDPDTVTLYTNSPRPLPSPRSRRYPQRDYVFNDTLDL